jgi:hypothetical protein
VPARCARNRSPCEHEDSELRSWSKILDVTQAELKKAVQKAWSPPNATGLAFELGHIGSGGQSGRNIKFASFFVLSHAKAAAEDSPERTSECNMSSKRGPVQVVNDELNRVEKYLAKHSLSAAGKALQRVSPEVQRLRRIWNTGDLGQRYDRLVDTLRVKSANPCDCWNCGFTADQKQRVIDLTKQKTAAFDCIEQSDHENNSVGAYAEVVFGVKFNLKINLERGSDGGAIFVSPVNSYLQECSR